ncbi:hypothetical protein [Agrococcus baldri]|uniref:Uncharacterized protein n=1 Tax=Agrococcus baldri TaxID=153730 RepID=A0AA87UXA3_9MICO|nr:hypothetical protein [Agrococcus baldri]GEK80222.1 hypothetical protein ABA31_15730 [Agrococcus baldri]
MDVEPSHGHPVLAAAGPVAIVAVLHAAVSTAIIAAVEPDVPDLAVYWLQAVLLPSLGWALLVLGRAAVWKRPSAFWLGASAGLVVLAAFVTAFLIVVGDISARGIPLALILSAWVLLACAVLVAVVLRVSGKHADAAIDADVAVPVAPV